jgi:hypothetical protein
VPHRSTRRPLPKEVLDPIVHYYGRVTRNPYVLMFVMMTAGVCLVVQAVEHLTPRWAAYSSLLVFAIATIPGVVKVIPGARRIASGREPADEQTRLVHTMFPAHAVILVCILVLALLQLAGT